MPVKMTAARIIPLILVFVHISTVRADPSWMEEWLSFKTDDFIIKGNADKGTIDVYEDMPIGHTIATLHVNAQPGDAVTITSDKNQLAFNSTGSFPNFTATLRIQLDFERQKGEQEVIVLKLNGGNTQYLVLNVVDVNDNTPVFTKVGAQVNLEQLENTLNASMLELAATDGDKEATPKLTYSLQTDSPDLFNLPTTSDPKQPRCTLTLIKELDFEKNRLYTLTVTATDTPDGRGKVRTAIVTVFITVLDVGDNPPRWTSFTSSTSIEETRATKGADVFTFTAIDGDTGVKNVIVYSVVNQTLEGTVAIDSHTGRVTLLKDLDREDPAIDDAQGFITITVKAQEEGSDCSNITCVSNSTLIQVIDMDDEDPTFEKDHYSVTVPEGSNSQLSLNINVTDKDSRYPNGAFVLGLTGAQEGVFKLSSSKGVGTLITDISIQNSTYLDFETRQKINFQVTAIGDNPGKRSATASVTVTLTDTNDNAPVFDQASYEATIDESAAQGRDVVTVTATDADSSAKFGTGSIRFTLSGGKQSALKIDGKTGKVTVVDQKTPPFDYDAGDRKFTYTVQARDNNGTGNVATVPLAITIRDVNDQPPTLQPLPSGLTVKENVTARQVISDEISASDVDTSAKLEFSIDWTASSGTKDGQAVKESTYKPCLDIETVQQQTGTVKGRLVTTATPLDREKVDTVVLAIVVTDHETAVGEPTASATTTISVQDVNDNHPYFTNINSSSTLSVTENWPIGVLVTTILAKDDDQDNRITYSLSGDAKFTSLVNLDAYTGQLTVANNIDREQHPHLTLTFIATDAGSPPLNTSLTLQVPVKDLNDCTPEWVTDPIKLTVSVLEGKATGKAITTLQATDADEPNTPASTITYLLVGDGKQNFTIDPSSGEVKVKGVLDREQLAGTNYALTVSVKAGDQCQGEQCVNTVPGYLQVQVNDTNDNWPVLPPPGDTALVDIDETKPAGSDVGSVRGTDADAADTPAATLTFTIASIQATRSGCSRTDLFAVMTDQNSAKLSTKGSLHGCWGEYALTLTATDGPPELHNTSQTYRARVGDINDPPAFVFPPDGFNFSIPENSYDGSHKPVLLPNGTHMQFTASDHDDSPNSKLTYKLLPSSTPGMATTTFTVDPNSGVLYLINQVDRESKDGYQFELHVEARDLGPGGGLFDTRVIKLTISDEDEFVPVFNDRQNDDTRFTEEQEPGAEIFDVTSIATDADDTDHIFYFVVGGDKDCFELLSSFGSPQLRTKQKLDREKQGLYHLILQTTSTNDYPGDVSHFDPNNQHQLNMTIIVQDINDNPPRLPNNLMAGVAAQDAKNVAITTIAADDPDLNETITYAIFNFTTEDLSLKDIIKSTTPFVLDETTGELKLNFDVDTSMDGWIDFLVDATDKAQNTDEKQMRVFIITEDDRVRFVFHNPVAIVTSSQDDVRTILTNIFKFSANLERIAESSEYEQSTEVRAHFIDLSKPAPVPANTIVNLQFTNNIDKQLIDQFHNIGLELRRIDNGKVQPKDDDNTVFQMLLIVVGSVLGGLFAITLIASCIQIKKLRRQVRALSINAFGSRDSGLQKAGLTVPGSNVYANQGTNPVFSMDDGDDPRAPRAPDAESQSSGDSVLIGVEDDPEFRGYKRPAPQMPTAGGADDVTPAVFEDGMRMPRFDCDADEGIDEGSVFPESGAGFPGSNSGVSQNPLFGANLDDMQ